MMCAYVRTYVCIIRLFDEEEEEKRRREKESRGEKTQQKIKTKIIIIAKSIYYLYTFYGLCVYTYIYKNLEDTRTHIYSRNTVSHSHIHMYTHRYR